MGCSQRRQASCRCPCWSTSSVNPRTADAAHRRRFGRPLAGPSDHTVGQADGRLLHHPHLTQPCQPYRMACAEASSEDLSKPRYGEQAVGSPGQIYLRLRSTQTRTAPMALSAAFRTIQVRRRGWIRGGTRSSAGNFSHKHQTQHSRRLVTRPRLRIMPLFMYSTGQLCLSINAFPYHMIQRAIPAPHIASYIYIQQSVISVSC
ncbi:hypothetical protein V8C35DRAFT_311246 [Trichoderma chlorosporum]